MVLGSEAETCLSSGYLWTEKSGEKKSGDILILFLLVFLNGH